MPSEWIDLGPLLAKRIRHRREEHLRAAVEAEAKRRTWDSLEQIVRYLESAGLEEDRTAVTLRGLAWARRERGE